MTQLCLNMIVRNESARIIRCLESVAPYISSWVITDTGSTDDTPKIIKQFFKDRKTPGHMHYAPFLNWAQARNSALLAAGATRLRGDYLLLCDADMELVVKDKDWLRGLDGISYDMMQHGSGLIYANRRLLRSDQRCKYLGVTHEYLDAAAAGMIEGAWFIDHADGGNRDGKFKRDIELLLDGLKTEPDNSRYWFYLGQSYRDLGQPAEAAAAYKKCVELGGWDEQVWNAQLNYATALKDTGDESGFIREMLIAHNMRPSRAETLYDLAKFYRVKGMNAASTVFSEAALQIPLGKDLLFVNAYAHTVGPREEFAVTAFYDPAKRARAFDMCDGLATDPNVSPGTRQQARSNLFHYVQPLHALMQTSLHRIPFVPPDGYTPMNPSVALIGERIMVIVRSVNYTITDTGHYAIKSGDGSINAENPIHTRNYLLNLNTKFEVEGWGEITYDWPEPPEYNLVRGFEDMRLFKYGNMLHFSANIRELNKEGWCDQYVGTISPDGVAQNIRRMSSPGEVLYTPPQRQHEKNWMPITVDRGVSNGPHFMYRLGHVIDTLGCTVSIHRPDYDVGQVNGGSQVIRFGSEYLAVVHEAFYMEGGQRYYVHRFAQLDREFKLLKLSKPFVFFDRQIEFAAGLAWHPDHGRLMISFGVRDREAWIATVTAKDVKGLFA